MNNPDNFSLSSDWLHLANDTPTSTATVSVPANLVIANNSSYSQSADISIDTTPGSWLVTWFESDAIGVSGKRIYSQAFSMMYAINQSAPPVEFVCAVSRVNPTTMRLTITADNYYWGSSINAQNPAFTVTAGVRSLVIT